MAKVWLTGGSGMVGRNVAAHLRSHAHDLFAPARAELDLLDSSAVSDWVKRHRPDVVIHAAGQVGGIQANIAAPVEFLERNTVIGRNVIMAARETGVSRLLNLASSCMYPAEAQNPLQEDMVLSGPLEPTNEGYALAKIFSMRLCDYITRQDDGMAYKTLIPCNLYGAWDTFTPGASHLLPAVIAKTHNAKQKGETNVEIWGDGTARREFMFAEDAADGIWEAVDRFEDLPQVMNLGLGHDHSVNDYYAAAADVIGWSGSFDHDLTKPVGMRQKLVDVTRQTKFGWSPKHSLTEGLSKTYAHYLEHHA